MKQTDAFRFRRGDWIAIGLVAVLAALMLIAFIPKDQAPAGYAQIYLDGELYKTVSLNEDTTFVIEDQYTSEITVVNGSISFSASNCPGQDCVHSGSIHTTGRSLVCLPNRVEIRVVAGSDHVDFVVG